MDWSSAQQSDVSCEIPSLPDNSINMLLTNRSLKRFILPSYHFPSITFLCVVITKTRILVPSISGLNPLLWHSLDGHQPFIKPQFPLQSPRNFSLDSLRQPKFPAVTEGWKKCFCVRKLFLAISCVKHGGDQIHLSLWVLSEIWPDKDSITACHVWSSSTHDCVHMDTFLLPTPSFPALVQTGV